MMMMVVVVVVVVVMMMLLSEHRVRITDGKELIVLKLG
jgi:hypothetical protein